MRDKILGKIQLLTPEGFKLNFELNEIYLKVFAYELENDNYDKLLDGERQKFDLGESSLFLVNSRETNTIAARLKLIELIAKYKIIEAELKRATGYLFIK